MALARKVDRLLPKREKKMDVAEIARIDYRYSSDVDRGEYSHSRAKQRVATCNKS